MSQEVVRVGAVAYDPRVVTIWEGLREYLHGEEVPTDYTLFSNYEAQIEALFSGVIDIAWNTNVAYVRSEERAGGRCRVLAMRDADREFTTRVVARVDRGIAGLEDLRGKRLAIGSADSAQAAILPLYYLRQAGLDPESDLSLLRFDLDVGKHGDTGRSELEVLRALHEDRADAGALGDPTWIRELEHGHVNSALLRSVWSSPPYYHCNFTALPGFDPERARRFTDALLRMDYNDGRYRHIMDLEGLTAWLPADKEGYRSLADALGLTWRPPPDGGPGR
ncbi:MAG: phosphate/phosphite/phosphonate ABC transporter substrate-binding protein [Actinomycetota bacterium]